MFEIGWNCHNLLERGLPAENSAPAREQARASSALNKANSTATRSFARARASRVTPRRATLHAGHGVPMCT